MTAPPRSLVLLGPQRLQPTLAEAVSALGIDGPIAAVTAGWQEREGDDQELREHLGRRTVNLELYRRAEELFTADAKLFDHHRRRQDELRELQGLYGRRLRHAMAAVRELLAEPRESRLVERERQAAIEALRRLDARHLSEIGRIHGTFRRRARPESRASLARQREELARLLEGCEALAIAGGHVAVLLNRLRLFDLPALSGGRPVFAWSAGAMALAERVVVFHDSPPQGGGDAEVLETGLGWVRGLLPFPHARRRLRLADPLRVRLLASRFSPAICVALDEGARIERDAGGWQAVAPARRMRRDGSVRTVRGPLEAET